jgi:GDP-mannose 6-dehydrogenase
LLESLLASNDQHIDHAEALVLKQGKNRIGVLGLAFKAGTDDLRESPALDLVRRLLDRGLAVRVLDDAVREATLIGANRRFVEEHLPQLPSLLVSSEAELMEHAELIVVTQGAARFRQWLDESAPHLPVIDLGGLYAATPSERNYDGIGW